jgi:hypothetical protein
LIHNQPWPPELFKDSGLRHTSGPFTRKRVPRLWIGTIEDRRKFVEGRFLGRLIDAYREIFGHGIPVDKKSWGEYAKCQDAACQAKLSFEATYNLESYVYIPDLERNLSCPDLPRCPSCQSPMTLFYLPHELQAEIWEEFLQHESYGALLVGEDERIYGFSYGWIANFQEIWRRKFQGFYKPASLTFETCREQCQRHLNCDHQFFYWAESGHLLPARGQDTFFAMSRSLLSGILRTRGDIQCIFSTAPSSNAHALLIGAGAKVICSLDDHPLQILSARVSDLWEEWGKTPSRFFRDNRARIEQALRLRRERCRRA